MEADSVRLDGLIRYRPARLLFLFLRILILATFVVSRPFVFTVAAIFMLRDPEERLENTSRSFVSVVQATEIVLRGIAFNLFEELFKVARRSFHTLFNIILSNLNPEYVAAF